MFNLVIFGHPGSEKGTQAEKIVRKYQLVHLSKGDLFREHITNRTALGQQVQQIIADGLLVPDQITIDMLEAAIKENDNPKGFIFDGLPRTVAQARNFY